MLTILVILAVLLQVSIALGMYFRRSGGHTNLIFMFLSLAIASWAFSDYVAITIPQNNNTIYAIRTVLSFVVIQNTLFFFFARTFPNKSIDQLSRWRWGVVAYSLFVLILTQSPFLFQSVSIDDGTANPNPGPVIIFFILQALLTIVLGFRSLWHRHQQADGQRKTQLTLILFAASILLIIVPITNFAITLILHTTLFVKFSPFYALFFGTVITYAIVVQKLFDIRAAVARSIGYLMVVVSITIVYGLGLFGVIDVLLPGTQHEFLRQVLSVILITPLALAFQRTRRSFDHITNRLFYRDAYNTQDVLDAISSISVSEIELYRILHDTRRVLNTALKNSFMEFVLFKDEKPFFEAHTRKSIPQNILALGTVIKNQKEELIEVDELSSQSELQNKFIDAGVTLSLKLKTREQVVGYIIFGSKRSGDIYNLQDKKLLLIVANELAISVQNALRFEQIENFNLTLQAKVDEATRQLRHVNERLKTLDETKDDFISMASHQLRTPLTSVKGYLSMVLEGDAGRLNETQVKMLKQAFSSSQRMVFLITDLLNISRLKTGKFVITVAPTDLSQMAQEEISQLKETAESRHVNLLYNKPSDFPVLMLDENKIRQVVMNFIDNAIYYTPAGGNIRIELENKPATVELRIIDNGIGVPKSEQHHLFMKFYRAGNARKVRPDGTGLGLFMAKKVIVAQGGSIIFTSKENQGSTFGFVFSKHRLKLSDTVKQDNVTTKINPSPKSKNKTPTKSLTPVR
ncbi:MAG: ATP-binding protein [Candidatus Saccharimonadales bacterium]